MCSATGRLHSTNNTHCRYPKIRDRAHAWPEEGSSSNTQYLKLKGTQVESDVKDHSLSPGVLLPVEV